MRVLAVAAASPPVSGPESAQVGRYLSFLARLAHVELVTGQGLDTGWRRPDDSAIGLEGVVRRVEVPGQYLFDRVGAASRLGHPPFPDAFRRFSHQARRARPRLGSDPEVVYSRSTPFSGALLAAQLARNLRVPWMMHLSDPWYGNPYHEALQTARHRRAEERCIRQADRVSFTSKETRDLYCARYPERAGVFDVFPNVFDPRNARVPPVDLHASALSVLHTGNFYGTRTPGPLITAVSRARLASSIPITLDLTGHVSDQARNEIDRADHRFVRYHGRVGASQLTALQARSHVLAYVDRPISTPIDGVFLLSKISDYLPLGRPMLGITDPGAASRRIVESRYGRCFGHADIPLAADWLVDAAKALMARDIAFFSVDAPDRDFDPRVAASRLHQTLAELITRS